MTIGLAVLLILLLSCDFARKRKDTPGGLKNWDSKGKGLRDWQLS